MVCCDEQLYRVCADFVFISMELSNIIDGDYRTDWQMCDKFDLDNDWLYNEYKAQSKVFSLLNDFKNVYAITFSNMPVWSVSRSLIKQSPLIVVRLEYHGMTINSQTYMTNITK